MEKCKKAVLQGAICVGLLVLVWGGYFLARYLGIERIMEIKANDYSWLFQIDSAKIADGDFVLKGFAFELGKDASGDNYEVVLKELESGKQIFFRTTMLERKDVNEYFLCEYDYLKSGFEARIAEKKIDIEKNYEVILRMCSNKIAYQTGIYLSKGSVFYTDPREFVPLQVEGTELESIVRDGILRVYRPDCGMYVYQYNWNLYWIAEPMYEFDSNGDTYVQYQLRTTQVNRLPQERLDNQLYWDNIGFAFSEKEVLKMNTGKYRVAQAKLPKEYAIEKIGTGNFVNEWTWQQDFRPYYLFAE